MTPLPKGISRIGFLTLFGSIGLVAFSDLTYNLGSYGVQYGHPFTLTFKLIIAVWVAFAVVGIALSTILFSGLSSKRLWSAFVLYWILLLAFWISFDLRDYSGTLRASTYGFAIWLFGPIVYSVGCIAYFLTKVPKRYFHFEREFRQ